MGNAVVITRPERRIIATTLHFGVEASDYINWNVLANTARELGADFEARYTPEGACTVTMFKQPAPAVLGVYRVPLARED